MHIKYTDEMRKALGNLDTAMATMLELIQDRHDELDELYDEETYWLEQTCEEAQNYITLIQEKQGWI